MNYSYIFGFISFIAFAFQLNSGLLLSCYYVPLALLASMMFNNDECNVFNSNGASIINGFIDYNLYWP